VIETVWDWLNVAYDALVVAKNTVETWVWVWVVVYWKIYWKQEYVKAGEAWVKKNLWELWSASVDLWADWIALAIPVVPAWTTKIAKVAKNAEKIEKKILEIKWKIKSLEKWIKSHTATIKEHENKIKAAKNWTYKWDISKAEWDIKKWKQWTIDNWTRRVADMKRQLSESQKKVETYKSELNNLIK